MNGIDLLNNMVDELQRARECLVDLRNGEGPSDDDMLFLMEDIEADLERYYDVADSINAMVEDIVVCE